MNCNFTLKHYEEICNIIAKSQYKICFFNNCSSNFRNVLILRHDVDQSLEQSSKMAKIENEYSIKSTFFIWLRSPFYNIFEKKYADIIYEIINLGHQIGLHFDESSYKMGNEIDLNNYIDKEVNIIKDFFNLDIFAISMHRPSKWILNNDIRFKKYINVYSKKYFEEFKYFSDSRRQWKEGCICNKINIIKYNKLHILIHPFWWTKEVVDLDKRMNNFIKQKTSQIDLDLMNNIDIYKK